MFVDNLDQIMIAFIILLQKTNENIVNIEGDMNNCPQSNHETSSKLSAIKIDDVSSKRTFQLNGSKVTELSSRVDIGRALLSCQQQQQQQQQQKQQAELPTGIIVTSHLTVETS